jgi:lysozyme
MDFSNTGLALLKSLEGFRSKAYPDSGGKMTIGYGHLIVKGDGTCVGDILEEVQATGLLKQDVQKAVGCVNGCVTSNINQNQFDALVIFTYNVGNNAFQHSTLLQCLNHGDFGAASKQFLVWCKVHTPQGRFIEVAGLKNRRLAEQKLFNTEVV